MNVYSSQLILNDNMTYHDSDPLFPTSDRGDPVFIQDQNMSALVSPFHRTIFAVCSPRRPRFKCKPVRLELWRNNLHNSFQTISVLNCQYCST